MIRKRYLAAAGLLTLAVVAEGCGKKNDAGSVVQAKMCIRDSSTTMKVGRVIMFIPLKIKKLFKKK